MRILVLIAALTACTPIAAIEKPIAINETIAAAMTACGFHQTVKENLVSAYGEQETWIGMLPGPSQLVVEMFANPESGSATIIVVNSKGLSCYWASIINWHRIEQKPKEDTGA